MFRRFLATRLTERQRRMLARAFMAHAQFLFAVILLQGVVADSKIRGIAAVLITIVWFGTAAMALWVEGIDREGGA